MGEKGTDVKGRGKGIGCDSVVNFRIMLMARGPCSKPLVRTKPLVQCLYAKWPRYPRVLGKITVPRRSS